ncbi:MAG: InlB B-repeat-containing protein [Clostridiales bacterium]|jgi:hypothetical protein|nr:InlB B-repeat-containing protein [Clostridiales bacterium]
MKSIRLIALMALSFLAIAACSSGPKYTVTFYDDTAVIKSLTVKEGEKVESFVPEKDGFNFINWYATPKKARAFDFEAPISADAEVFAGFSQHKDDTREFYILGSGTSKLLLSSNWGSAIDDEHKLAKASGKNEYSITLDLNAGDEFQFAIDSKWRNKRGFGYLAGNALDDGTEAFTGSGTIGDTGAKGSNIKVGVSGNYTLTLTTYPADDFYDSTNPSYVESDKEVFNVGTYDRIDWVRNGDAQESADVTTDYYIKGAKITGWQDVWTDETKFANDNGVYTLKVHLEEGDEFMFTSTNTVSGAVSAGSQYIRHSNLDAASQGLFDKTDSLNLIVLETGDYIFTYAPESEILTASKS